MPWATLFLLVTLGVMCHNGNVVKGLVLFSDGAPTDSQITGTAHLTHAMTSEHTATPSRINGKHQATSPALTRETLGNLGHSIVDEQPTTSGDGMLVTTGKQTSPAGRSPTASILAISVSVCLLFLLFGVIFITICLVSRNRKRRLEEGGETGDKGNKNGSGRRERLASHVQPKQKDTRSNADDNHPCVVYSVNESRTQSFGHMPSFSEMPPFSATAHIENEVIDFKDDDAILEHSETKVKHGGNDKVDCDVHGFENFGYLPKSPQVHAKTNSTRSSRLEGTMVAVSTEPQSADEDSSEECLGPVVAKRDLGGSATRPTLPIVHKGEGLAKDIKIKPVTPKEDLSDIEVDISSDVDDKISASSRDSSGSSVCGFWAPNAEADGNEVGEKGDEGNDSVSSSGEDVSSFEDVEPPYSTWPGRKTSTQLSESGSDVSVIEPIGSEEEEDPYDTIVPGAPMVTENRKVKPKIKCISALEGQFSDSDDDEEPPHPTSPKVSVHDERTCDDKDCKTCCQKCTHDFGEGRISPYEMADQVDRPNPGLTKCHLCAEGPMLDSDSKAEATADEEEESPYDTLPAGRPRSLDYVDGADSEAVKKRSPTYTTVPHEVLGPFFKERVETFFVKNVSSSEESLADEGEFGMDTKRMSLEINDLADEGEGQGHLEGQGQIEITDDSFVFVGEGGIDSFKSV